MRRIIVLSAEMGIGGAERVIASLSYGLRQRGHEVIVCTLKAKGQIGASIEERGIELINLAGNRKKLGIYTTFYRLLKLVRDRRIDIVHSHGTAALWDAALARTFVSKAKLIHTFHYGNYPNLRWQNRLMERLSQRRADRLVAVGYEQRSAIAETYGIDEHKMSVVLNGVGQKDARIDASLRNKYAAESQVVIGSVSTLIEQKGIEYLIEAAKILVRRKLNFKIIIAGDGVLRDDLESRVMSEGLSNVVGFLGWVDDAAAIVLPAIDIFVQPSLWEAMSIVVLEAMAAGLPMVITNVGDNARVVENGITGFIVDPADPQQLADKLTLLIEDTRLRTQIGASARDVQSEEYSDMTMVDSYLTLYERCLERP
jgi:glycosyltransferase involved in cell wall biosynthesis